VGGALRILALDHENTLRRRIREAHPELGEPGDDDLVALKLAVLDALRDEVSGVLLDPRSFAAARDRIDPETVLVKLTAEWTPERLGAAGARTVKLMAHDDRDAPEAVLAAQREAAREIGERCARSGVAFALEAVTHRRPDTVLALAREFARPEYRADLLKLDFPGDAETCRAVHEACDGIPWTIRSAGMTTDEFVDCVRVASEAGAAGYICGQGIWADAIDAFPDAAAMSEVLRTAGVANARRINDALTAQSSASS
jgi:tagatose-1,6-bisphosphate aldolase